MLFGQLEQLDLPLRSCRTYEELHQAALDTLAALDHWFSQEREKSNNSLAENMLSFIHDNYNKDISLFSLADYLNLSRNYVSTLFKNIVGRNFKDYLGEFRFQMACKLVEEQPKKKIKEIAEQVGCTTEILTRLFVRHSDLLSSEYQQRLWQDELNG
ncbi:YesN/AraC family two-component response regulator [Paenibacillus sp. V4I3]|uniref:helix-turn-helix domain-containing protein n=1 Tax=Paenibacillus sp. V4I3 TaxID=3042305 RepID=UPI0027831AA3|nr:helix-turn-helix domain-containing protein [Paenibacillus sp. V4I3]MDQ0872686.1 YesN/AraC family two-component response regulator [Paenibacillus sp. V4I3]